MSPVVDMVGGTYLIAIGVSDLDIRGLGPILVGAAVFYIGVARIMGWPA